MSYNESILGQDENPILTQAKITSSKLNTPLDRLSINRD